MTEKYFFTAVCTAPKEIFEGDFDDLSPEHQALFTENVVRCESGKLRVWCERCRFGVIEEYIRHE